MVEQQFRDHLVRVRVRIMARARDWIRVHAGLHLVRVRVGVMARARARVRVLAGRPPG